MKVGDLVKHQPIIGSTCARLYEAWGHERDFKTGLIIEEQVGKGFKVDALEKAAAWYIQDELEVISEGR